MGRLLGWLGFLGGVLIGWYERLFSLEWVGWLFGGAFELIGWLLRGLLQVGLAILALIGIGGAHVPAWPSGSGAAFVTHDFATAFLRVLKDHDGEFGPENWKWADKHYWILVRTTTDTTSYVDGNNKGVRQDCQHLYAAPAAMKDGQYLAPQPLNMIGGITWPEAVIRCRVEGGDTTYEFPTLHEKGTVASQEGM